METFGGNFIDELINNSTQYLSANSNPTGKVSFLTIATFTQATLTRLCRQSAKTATALHSP